MRRILSTNCVLDPQAIKLSLGESTPHLRPVDFVGIIETTVDRHNVLHKDVDGLGMLLVLLVDRKRFLVQPVVSGNLRNFRAVVVLELVDVVDNLALVRTDRCQQHQVLEVAVLAEGRGLNDDLLQELDELDGQVSREECLDSDRDIVGVRALWDGSGSNLHKDTVSYIDDVEAAFLKGLRT